MKHELSILIPTYNGDCRPLVRELWRQADSVDGLNYEIVAADDGSTDHTAVTLCREIGTLPHCRLIERQRNEGRAAIRNFLAREAQYQWLLFLDGDMSIPRNCFLQNYLDCNAPIAYGGYIVGQGHPQNLRYLYEKACEPQHSPEQRRKRPFQHFHTCNFMVSRDILTANPFDERFHSYGYEDVFFGKQLKQAGHSITHIDNPAGFFTFEDNAHFVSKTEEGLRTLHQFQKELQGYSQMLTFVNNIHFDIVKSVIRLWHRLFGNMERRNLCSQHPNLTVFKIYKIGYYLNLKN